MFDWDYLFKVLTKSSPASLFRFKFDYNKSIKMDSLKLFFDNWKGRHPMLLQTDSWNDYIINIDKYKAEGIIKLCDNILKKYFICNFS